jgi:hypothetical protein
MMFDNVQDVVIIAPDSDIAANEVSRIWKWGSEGYLGGINMSHI